tara:strand:- start:3703 stop:3978 length:276 start_codon:yes stop_codon:yes gene_type:complete
MNREEVLMSALDCITNDRANQYGKAEDNFGNISKLWSAYLRIDISKLEVAMLMTLVKVARTISSPKHEDNYVDICGYSAIANELAKEKNND